MTDPVRALHTLLQVLGHARARGESGPADALAARWDELVGRLQPTYWPARFELYRAGGGLGTPAELERAAELVQIMLESEDRPMAAAASILLGNLHRRAGHPADATHSYRQALEFGDAPRVRLAWLNLAVVAIERGAWSEVEDALSRIPHSSIYEAEVDHGRILEAGAARQGATARAAWLHGLALRVFELLRCAVGLLQLALPAETDAWHLALRSLDTNLCRLTIRDPELPRTAEIVATYLGATDRGDTMWAIAGRLWDELGDARAAANARSRRTR